MLAELGAPTAEEIGLLDRARMGAEEGAIVESESDLTCAVRLAARGYGDLDFPTGREGQRFRPTCAGITFLEMQAVRS